MSWRKKVTGTTGRISSWYKSNAVRTTATSLFVPCEGGMEMSGKLKQLDIFRCVSPDIPRSYSQRCSSFPRALNQEVKEMAYKSRSNTQIDFALTVIILLPCAPESLLALCMHTEAEATHEWPCRTRAWPVRAFKVCCSCGLNGKVDHRLFLHLVIGFWKWWFQPHYLSIFCCAAFYKPLENYQDCWKTEFVEFLGWMQLCFKIIKCFSLWSLSTCI